MDTNTDNRIRDIELAAELQEIQSRLESIETLVNMQIQAVNKVICGLMNPNKIAE